MGSINCYGNTCNERDTLYIDNIIEFEDESVKMSNLI